MDRIETNHSAKQWGLLVHLSSLSGWIGLPLGWILGPLVVWSMKKDKLSFVADQGSEAINFQINMFVFMLASAFASMILIGIPFLILFSFASLICPIIAAIEASKGNYYRYPMVKFRVV